MTELREVVINIVLLLIPFLLYMFLRKPINRWFKRKGWSIRFIDTLSLILIILSHFLSVRMLGYSLLPYFFTLISALGIIIISVYYFNHRDTSLNKAIRVWWRVVDLASILMLAAIVVVYIFQIFF